MEIHFSADNEARLRDFAKRNGKNTAEVIEEAVDQMLGYDAAFIEAVDSGRAAAVRGELLEHEEVVARIERALRS